MLLKKSTSFIKSPLNYIGGKQKILDQLLPLFPKRIDVFVDLFAGGCSVALNVKAKKVICNDICVYLIEMYQAFQTTPLDEILAHIESRIEEFKLSMTNEYGYLKFRQFYNRHRHPIDLFVLVAHSFNHQIRFNNKHEFNNPFGRERSCFNPTMKFNLIRFVRQIQAIDIEFISKSFEEFDFNALSEGDFFYCDPPYLITIGTYNDGKRGFKGWSEKEESDLLRFLDKLNERNVRFALSNVIEHKGKKNQMLLNWTEARPFLKIHPIDSSYANSNYQTTVRDKSDSKEVLITNYDIDREAELTLFD